MCTVIVIPEQLDLKICSELGASIMLDKPIFALVRPGVKVAESLSKIVYRFIEFDVKHPEHMSEALVEVMNEYAQEKGIQL